MGFVSIAGPFVIARPLRAGLLVVGLWLLVSRRLESLNECVYLPLGCCEFLKHLICEGRCRETEIMREQQQTFKFRS
jgi:hypothetical protein